MVKLLFKLVGKKNIEAVEYITKSIIPEIILMENSRKQIENHKFLI